MQIPNQTNPNQSPLIAALAITCLTTAAWAQFQPPERPFHGYQSLTQGELLWLATKGSGPNAQHFATMNLTLRLSEASSGEIDAYFHMVEQAYLAPDSPGYFLLRQSLSVAPPDPALRWLMDQTLLSMETEYDISTFFEVLRGIKFRLASPELHDELADRLDEVYRYANDLPRGREIQAEVITLWGGCGARGLAYIQDRNANLQQFRLPYHDSEELLAILENGGPDAREALNSLVKRLPNLPAETQDILHATIEALLNDPDPSRRTNAVRLANLSKDPRYIPMLQHIAENDPHTFLSHTYEGQTRHEILRYNIRDDARQAMHDIRYATDPTYRRKYHIERHITNLERQLQHYQERIASGIDLPSNQAGVRSVTNLLQEAHAELEALQNQQPQTTP